MTSADKVLGDAAKLVDEYSSLGELVDHPSSRVSVTGPATGGVFINQRQANIPIAEEKSQHLIMVFLKAKGYTNNEIAKATGYSVPWISQVTRQPWFKERLSQTIKEAGMDPVKAFLQNEALPSLEALTAIRDNSQAPAAARVAAANSVLDRAFGKPTQHIQSESIVNVKTAKGSAEAIEIELASINEQLKARGQPVTGHN